MLFCGSGFCVIRFSRHVQYCGAVLFVCYAKLFYAVVQLVPNVLVCRWENMVSWSVPRCLVLVLVLGRTATSSPGSLSDSRRSSVSLLRLLVLRCREDLSQQQQQASLLETLLTSQPAGRGQLRPVLAIAQYLFHRHNPHLPTLAVRLLLRLAKVGAPPTDLPADFCRCSSG